MCGTGCVPVEVHSVEGVCAVTVDTDVVCAVDMVVETGVSLAATDAID